MKFDLGTHVEQTPPPPRPKPEPEWTRPHILSPLVEAWKGTAVVLIIGFQPLQEFVGELSTDVRERFFLNSATGILALIFVAALIGVIVAWLAWLFTRYTLGEEAVQLRSGVLWRNRRQARLDRLQAVDVVQPFLARLVGLAELRVEVAGGTGTAVRIAYLKEGEAQRLRNQILARSAGLELDEEAPAPEAPENELFEVPFGRLIGSLVLSSQVIFPVLLVVFFAVLAIIARTPEPLLANLPLLFLIAVQVWQRLNRGAFFRAATSPDGVRITHGLLEQRRQTVPPGRIQAIRLTQPLLWRLYGWWRVDMNVAGYGTTTAGQALVNDLLPVGKLNDALRALWLVVPDFEIDDTDAVLNHAMVGSGAAGEFTTSPKRVRIIDPLVVRRTGFRITPRALLIRRGRLTRHMIVVPHERIQSVSIYQGPIQRSLQVARFQIDSTVGPVAPVVPHLDTGTVAALMREQIQQARQARAADRTERWMAAEKGD